MIVIDVEATGLDVRKHALLSIGAVDLNAPEREFYSECRVFSGAEISEEALEVNGFTYDEITDPSKQAPEILLNAFMRWALESSDRTTAGMNVGVFDLKFIEYSCKRHGIDFILPHRSIDLHTVAYMHMLENGVTPPSENNRTALNLKAVLEYCGVEDVHVSHNALDDAKQTAFCLRKLLKLT